MLQWKKCRKPLPWIAGTNVVQASIYKCKSDLNCSQIYFFRMFRLPFDWKSSTIAYFVAVALEMVMHITLMCWTINIIFLMIGFVSFLGLHTEQLEFELENLNTKPSDESQQNTKICSIIELHCEAKQLQHTLIKFCNRI